MMNPRLSPSTTPTCHRGGKSIDRPIWLLSRSSHVKALGLEIEVYGYSVIHSDRSTGLPEHYHRSDAGLIIVETTPGDLSIMAFIRQICSLPAGPGIMVIDRDFEALDRILAFETGVDDCVPWPCSARELVARIRAILRRRPHVPSPVSSSSPENIAHPTAAFRFAGWTLDPRDRRLSRAGKPDAILPATEFAMLAELLRRPGKVVGRHAFLKASAAISAREIRNLRAVDSQIVRLRRRLESDSEEIIRTVQGRGYMLIVSVIHDGVHT